MPAQHSAPGVVSLVPGTVVEARFGGEEEWYGGKITKANRNGTYDVLYDDAYNDVYGDVHNDVYDDVHDDVYDDLCGDLYDDLYDYCCCRQIAEAPTPSATVMPLRVCSPAARSCKCSSGSSNNNNSRKAARSLAGMLRPCHNIPLPHAAVNCHRNALFASLTYARAPLATRSGWE